MRDYTPRYFDPVALTLDIDFVLHGDGPASTWAANARPGDEIMIGGPRGSLHVPEAFDWYLLVGDETALPAIGRRIEELPATKPVIAVIEVPEAADAQQFQTAAPVGDRVGLSQRARSRRAEPAAAGGGADRLPKGDGYAFVAGEAQMSKALRHHLVARGIREEYVRAPG